MTPRDIACLLIPILMLTGCFPSADPTLGVVTEQPEDSATSRPGGTQLSSSDAYLFLVTTSTPITYDLARIPEACLLRSSPCKELQTIHHFPTESFTPSSLSPFHWSPDGSQALILNAYTSELLRLNPSVAEISQVVASFHAITDQLAWSPDGDWVALAAEGPDPYTSRVVMLNSQTDEVWELLEDLEGIKFPLGWISAHELVFLQVRYEYPDGDASQKKTIAGQDLLKVNTEVLAYERLVGSLDFRGDSLPAVSPDGTTIATTVVRSGKAVLDVYSSAGTMLRSFGAYSVPVWSPDGRRIAATLHEGDGYSVAILDPVGDEERKLLRLDSPPLVIWSPNGVDLAITSRAPNEQGSGETLILYRVSSAGGETQVTDLGKVVGAGYEVLSISFRPGTLP